MSLPQFQVTTRAETGRALNRQLRASNHVPGVLYGKGKANVNLCLQAFEVARILSKGAIDQVTLLFDDKKSMNVKVKAKQVHPVTDRILHLDFQYLPE